MASSKPKKGFSMSLSKPKTSSSIKGPSDRANSTNSKSHSVIGVAHDDEDDDESGRGGKRDYVTGIGGGKVVTKEVVVERGPRVIALASNPWAKGSSTAASADVAAPLSAPTSDDRSSADEPPAEKSLDQLAVEAIVQESRGDDVQRDGDDSYGRGLGMDSDRVIAMAGEGERGEGGATTTTSGVDGKRKTGLLEQNMIPGLMDVDGEDAKFRHDLGHRAKDLSPRSKAYVDVPVAEFGAALLRGMGWTGPEKDGGGGKGGDGREIEPRHHRLGLGAQPKPPEKMERPRKRKPGEKAKASDEARQKIWEQKAQEERSRASGRSSETRLSVMDVVELPSEGGDRRRPPRAMVLKTQGVPGLNKISVRMEDTGEKVLVDKSSVTRVSEDELARRPFSENKHRSPKRSSSRSDGGHRSSSRSRSRRRDDSGRKRDRNRSRSRSRSRSGSRGSASVEREGEGRERRDGGRKGKTSKKDKKKHKKSGSSSSSGGGVKRERERSSDGRRPSRSPRRSDEERDRNTDGRRADRASPDRRRDGRGRGREDDTPADRKKRRRDDDAERKNGYGASSNGHHTTTNGVGGGQQQHESVSEPPSWLRPNIRVRVVHKSYAGGRAYLGKGSVVDVPRAGQATVRMDLGDLVLEGVKELHLETVVPAKGGKAIVVRGADKGATGKLLAKNKEKETALLQVYEDLRAITLSLDDVAEFTGMLDEDMDDVGY